jgi:hypothetical protein
MKIDFNYNKKILKSIDGYIFKGALYRCSYTRFESLYRRPAPGTETVEIYNFEPKKQVNASVMLLQGLGSRNVKFLLWMGTHLASAGIHCSIPVLPGNYTRVEHGSVSGRSYLHPKLDVMFRFWEHAIVDIRSTIDLLEQKGLWQKNNCIMGYCLGGMLLSILCALDKRISQSIFMTTGGHLPKILHESPATSFARKQFNSSSQDIYKISDKKELYSLYDKQLPKIKNMSLHDILTDETSHPLFKIDPLSYAHFLDKSKTTFIDALLDETLPLKSRTSLYKEMKGSTRYIIPATHVSWLLFERFLAQYILFKVNINDKWSIKQIRKKLKLDTDIFFNE